MRFALLMLPLLACDSAPGAAVQSEAGLEMRPETFFAGRALGTGTLTIMGKARRLSVESVGAALQDGSFRLDQTIRFEDGKASRRDWIMRRLADGTYRATLSDAAGMVSGEARGNVFELEYLARRPAVRMAQTLTLQPDGRTVVNLGRVTALGIPIGKLTETIVRDAPLTADTPAAR